MAKVEGIDKVNKALANLAKKGESVSVVVGYTAAYALAVHERVEMKWRGFPRDRSVRKEDGIAVTGYSEQKGHKGLFWGPAGQAKFLEQPARELAGTLGKIVADACKKGATLLQGLFLAGLRLQRESQKLVPVEFGNLRASAFTRKED